MSWTPELVIGELRPWPESVKVVRGNSGEAMRYDRAERSKNGVERSNDGVAVTVAPDDYTAKLMAEVERLQGENAKLRELVKDMWHDGMCECDERWACAECEYHFPESMRELGIEVDE